MTSFCRYFCQEAASAKVASGLKFPNFSYFLVNTNIFICLVRHVLSTRCSLFSHERFENAVVIQIVLLFGSGSVFTQVSTPQMAFMCQVTG